MTVAETISGRTLVRCKDVAAMNTITRVATSLLMLMLAAEARADPLLSPLYGVTDLGTDYTLQTDANGYTHTVTSGDGSATYAFEKSPVTMINEIFPGGSHSGSYTALTLENNGHKVGYKYDRGGSLG